MCRLEGVGQPEAQKFAQEINREVQKELLLAQPKQCQQQEAGKPSFIVFHPVRPPGVLWACLNANEHTSLRNKAGPKVCKSYLIKDVQ